MRIVMVSTFDLAGGASRSAYRLHQGLQHIGIDSRMLVQRKDSQDPTVMGPNGKMNKWLSLVRPDLDAVPFKFYRHREASTWGCAWLPYNLASHVNRLKADLVNLHWIFQGFIPVSALSRLKQPVVWTIHDCCAFTGGCHYPFDCEGYKKACGHCPQLGSDSDHDLSRRIWLRKFRRWKDLDLVVVSPSRWLAQCARNSSLFKDRHIEVIPYCLDLTRYKPVKQEIARELLGLPHDKKLILFGANQAMQDPRKGFHYLQSALQNLSREGWQEKAELLVFGEAQISKPPETGLKTRVLGWLHDDVSLSLAYAAADVYVCPSLQDNLPNAVIEASACGTPTLAFQIGGLPDLIEHLQTGFLARPFESDDLARGLHYLLSDEQTRKAMGLAARAKTEREFEPFRVAGQYAKLFEDTLRAV